MTAADPIIQILQKENIAAQRGNVIRIQKLK